ncbi:glucose PTS transporter subunit IIA [Clostridium sp. AN503]|uniref:PTS beta-glucoside transporter subunit IIBCA n=1 Tax=Clostridium sp. AN503 TaxID=3160598 RepID=UPI00345A22D3
MDYKKAASEVYRYIGGGDNLISAAHCATRLRLVIADNDRCDRDAVENIEGVSGVFFASGQLQIIFGTGTVNKVYDEFIKLAGISEASRDEVKQAAAAKQNVFKRAIKTLGDVFVPIIPAIVASGLLMGLLEGLANVFPAMTQSGTYTIIHLFSNAAFVFLPILIAVSAAKVFGGNIFLGAVIGMIMIHTDLVNAWSVASLESIPSASVWFGLYDVNLVGYQGHVIPVVIAVWLMSSLEKKLHKIVPEIIDLFVTPLVTVLVTGYLTLTVIGPVFSFLENMVFDGALYLVSLPFGIGAAVAGAVYAPTVVAGVHHMYNALEAGLLSAGGLNVWMPIATAANVGQGAAALAVALRTKNQKTRSMALPASLSAFLGITEPAIFGVNIRFMSAFAAGCIGGFAGGLVAGIMKVGATAYGITGVFGFLITTQNSFAYLMVIVVSVVVAFSLSWIFYKGDGDKRKGSSKESSSKRMEVEADTVEAASRAEIYCPLEGEIIPAAQVKDETFAQEIIGKTVAVVPERGRITAPFDGEVSMVFETGHAVGLKGPADTELLIHVGINTVDLKGKYFKIHTETGKKVKKGDLLLEFDIDGIRDSGYDATTMVILANTPAYSQVWCASEGHGDSAVNVMTVVK